MSGISEGAVGVMSAVRMCDGCGKIFPEGEEGSSVGNVTVNRRNDRGRLVPENVVQDRCSECNMMGAVQPRLAISATEMLPQ